MPRLRRLCGAKSRAADDARPRRRAREDRVHQRHRLLEPLSLLHGDLRLPHDPRPRAGNSRPASSSPIPSSTCGSSPATATRLSIGGNHTMHVLRRNLDCQILLFNNEIYGLTKGQYSPTSRVGTRSPSTPFGSVDRPVTPCMFALGSGARFIARGIDVHKNLPEVLKAAHAHHGASFVEIYQNCIVYNDDVFARFTERERRGGKAIVAQAWREDAVRRRRQGPCARRRAPAPEGRRGRRSGGDRPRPEEQGHRRDADRNARQLPGRARRHLRGSQRRPSKAPSSSRTQRPHLASSPTSRSWSARARPGWSKRSRASSDPQPATSGQSSRTAWSAPCSGAWASSAQPARDAGADHFGEPARHRQLRRAMVRATCADLSPRLHARHRRPSRHAIHGGGNDFAVGKIAAGQGRSGQARRPVAGLLHRHAQPSVARLS